METSRSKTRARWGHRREQSIQEKAKGLGSDLAGASQAEKLPKEGESPYIPPKQKGNPPYVRSPQGGFKDASGNIWTRDKLHKDHWDVYNPRTGKYKNVLDNGTIRNAK